MAAGSSSSKQSSSVRAHAPYVTLTYSAPQHVCCSAGFLYSTTYFHYSSSGVFYLKLLSVSKRTACHCHALPPTVDLYFHSSAGSLVATRNYFCVAAGVFISNSLYRYAPAFRTMTHVLGVCCFRQTVRQQKGI